MRDADNRDNFKKQSPRVVSLPFILVLQNDLPLPYEVIYPDPKNVEQQVKR